ncbi:uncharacterized protein LOC127001960 [Eriocheir sinensis]|uniref:uncharacterized protein LOC127001960 n=1 Tax=Eriocheir sinensis TaxID=95602 RepID=UPI0021C8AB62|nr:uncharacterized protein LOC127001960 [Eriocheir sinensis]
MAQQDGVERLDASAFSNTLIPDMLLQPKGYEADVVLFRATMLLNEERVCVCDVLEMLRVIRRDILENAAEEAQMVAETTGLGLLTLEMLGKLNVHRHFTLRGKWERIAFLAVSCLNLWQPGVFRPGRAMAWGVKLWVGEALFRDDLCPNALLRLELLRFVAMWDVMDMMEPYLGFFTTRGLLHNALHLSASRLLPVGREGLLGVLRTVLYDLHVANRLGPLVARSCRRIEALEVRHNDKVLAHLVQLMGKAAERLRWMRRKKIKSSRKTIAEFIEIVRILLLLTAVPPYLKLYDLPGMCQLAGGAVATTLRCIVLTPVDAEANGHLKSLLCDVDEYFLCLGTHQSRGTLLEDLRRHHGRALTQFSERMLRHGCQPSYVPQPLEERRPCVPRFMDGMTKRLMERPVRLEAVDGVVDCSTLLRFMLVQEIDPWTGRPLEDLAYTPLDGLRDEIRAWKREVARGEHDQDEDGEQDEGSEQDEDEEQE